MDGIEYKVRQKRGIQETEGRYKRQDNGETERKRKINKLLEPGEEKR